MPDVSQIPKQHANPSHVALPCSLEKETNNEYLKPSHAYHHQALNDAEIEDSPFCTPNRAEIAILSGAEVLLVPCNSRELARELENGFLQRRCLFR